jgi:hypothetical protein
MHPPLLVLATLPLFLLRFMDEFYRPVELIPPEDAKLGGVTSEMARRYV